MDGGVLFWLLPLCLLTLAALLSSGCLRQSGASENVLHCIVAFVAGVIEQRSFNLVGWNRGGPRAVNSEEFSKVYW